MKRHLHRNYLIAILIAASSVCAAVGALNYAIDPYGFYRLIDVSGLNQQKEGVRQKIRYVKALELPLRKPSTVIIGSSRVHDGINPSHILLNNNKQYKPVYNLGIDMARIHESLEYLKFAILNGRVKRVVLGIDFFMFNASQKLNSNFDANLVSRRLNVGDYLSSSIFSADAFQDSLRTIRVSHNSPKRKEFLSNGFRPGSMVFYGVKNYQGLHYFTNYIFLSSLPSPTKYYFRQTSDQGTFKDFDEFLRICVSRGIDLKIYISPAHANLDGEGILASGNWDSMESWKKKIVAIAGRYEIPIWDFSGYNSITTEPVRTPMKYYWDSSHFTEVVGDLMLKRMFGKGALVPKDFGFRLTENNIDRHLAHIRKARQSYAHDHELELVSIHNSYQLFLNGGSMDLAKVRGIF